MIAYIKGEVAWIEEERIVLESGNIGYNIMMPASSFDTQDLYAFECKGRCNAVVWIFEFR